MNKRECVLALRTDPQAHCNCCQAVLVAFRDECGLTEEEAMRLGAHFGSGMRHGSTCGAVTGALMVLGMAGHGSAAATELTRRFREKNQALDCASLLGMAKEKGEERKSHCDRMICDAAELLEELLAQ